MKLYKLKKINGYWEVQTIAGEVTQFKSAVKANCRDWLIANNLEEETENV